MAIIKHNINAISKISSSSLEGRAIAEYLKRLQNKLQINQAELKGDFPGEVQKIQEGKLLLKSIKPEHYVIALEEKGKEYTSQDFAEFLSRINQPIYYIIGGAYGLSDEVRKRANHILSLSKLTFPHILARVILVEQIYRAEMILAKHPYHK